MEWQSDTAAGRDYIPYSMIRYIDYRNSVDMATLLAVYNDTLAQGDSPIRWKKEILIPFLKDRRILLKERTVVQYRRHVV